MEGYQIALLILGIIVGLYIVLIVVDLIFVYCFKRNFKNHSKALAVILSTKYENIKKVVDIFNKNSIPLDFKYIEMLNSIDPSSFPNLDGKKCTEDRHNLALLRDELLFMIKNSELISKHIEVKNAISYIQEVDNNYRVLLAAYNADVLGYNYWIHFLPSRFIFKLLKTQNKQLIA